MPQRKNATFAEATKSIEPLTPSLQLTKAISTYGLIKDGDKIAVCNHCGDCRPLFLHGMRTAMSGIIVSLMA